MLDVDEALGERRAQIRDRHIVLQVDELALLGLERGGRAPERHQPRSAVAASLAARLVATRGRRGSCSGRMPGMAGRLLAGRLAIGEHVAQFELPVRRAAKNRHCGCACARKAPSRGEYSRAPPSCSPACTQGDHPPLCNSASQAILPAQGPLPASGATRTARTSSAALRRDHRVTRETLGSPTLEFGAQRRRTAARGGRVAARIDDRSHPHAPRGEPRGRGVHPIMVGEQHQLPTDANAIAREEAFGGAQQHDARPVVVDKGDRALDRSHGDHEGARPHVVQGAARPACRPAPRAARAALPIRRPLPFR